MSDRNSTERTGNPLAVVLWVIVSAGLLYGISQTVIKAAALFTG